LSRDTLTTRFGAVQGRVEGEVFSLYNVPYARPPLGELRFAEAVAPERWEGVRDGRRPGLIAPQPPSGVGSYVPGDPTLQGEDCLQLNVFSSTCPGAGRPVLVFVHGGAFATGSGAGVMYDGAALARAGVVVVTVNYRLGALGFLSHPALAATEGRAQGNWALTDVLAALRFVRGHAELFGGDPHNVTLVGQSSGAMLVADLLGAPEAQGLFARAVLESGAVLVDRPERATATAEELAALLGLPGVERRALLGVATTELLEASATLSASRGGLLSMPFRPTIEPGVLPIHPLAAIRRGVAAGKELLIGTTRDEFALFSTELVDEGLGAARLTALVEQLFAATAPELEGLAPTFVQQYAAARHGGAEAGRALFDAIATDGVFRLPALRLAEAQSPHGRVFNYRFDWRSPFLNGNLGACHGIELPFVFGTLANPVVAMFSGGGPEAVALAEAVQGAWARFAALGDPSGGRAGRWPEYLPDRRTMLLGPSIGISVAVGEAERRLWAEHLVDASEREASTARR